MNLRPTYLIAATTLFSVLSTGCGGGGGGSGGNAGYSDASLNGLYYGGHFNLNTGGTESSFTAISFDGRGQGSMDVDHNRVDNQVGTRFSDRGLDQTYSVQADASAIVTAYFPASGGSTTQSVNQGMVGAGGNTLVFSALDNKGIHNVSFGFKAGTGHTIAKLNGYYHGVGLKCRRLPNNNTGPYRDCAWLNERNTFYLNGAGSYSASSWNPATVVSNPDNSGGTYTVIPDGRGTVTSDKGGGAKEVWFSADRSLLVQAEVLDNWEQKLYVGMRKGSSYTNSTLTGTYSFGMVGRGNSLPDGYWEESAVGTLVFDGAGTVTLQGTGSDRNNTGTTIEATSSYSIDSDGLLTLTLEHGPLQGVVSADGRTLAIVYWGTSAHGMLVATKQ